MLFTNLSTKKGIDIPKQGAFASDDDAAKRKRKELAEKLKKGQKVSVTPAGTVVDPNSAEAKQGDKVLNIPDGKLASDDDAAKRKRKELAEKLKKGQKVSVTPAGTVVDPNSPEAKQGDKVLNIPDGKLASFYWYNRDRELFEAEKKAMRESFPQFELHTLDDGRLCWAGTLYPCGPNDIAWSLQVVYDHNHPSNSTYGGSVKIYSIVPDLDELNAQVGLPHLLRDGSGNLYMCTARREDVDAGSVVTSASSALRWAVKWTFGVTMWLNGEMEKPDHIW